MTHDLKWDVTEGWRDALYNVRYHTAYLAKIDRRVRIFKWVIPTMSVLIAFLAGSAATLGLTNTADLLGVSAPIWSLTAAALSLTAGAVGALESTFELRERRKHLVLLIGLWQRLEGDWDRLYRRVRRGEKVTRAEFETLHARSAALQNDDAPLDDDVAAKQWKAHLRQLGLPFTNEKPSLAPPQTGPVSDERPKEEPEALSEATTETGADSRG